MDLNGIFSILEKISKDIENNDSNKQSIMDAFDKKLGISKEQHDKVVSLIDAFSDSEENIEQYNSQIDECTTTITKLNEAIRNLEDELSKTKKKSDRRKKQSEIDEKKEDRSREKERKQRLEDSKAKETKKRDRLEKQLNKRGVTNIATARTDANKMENDLIGLTKGGGGMAAKVSKFAKNPYIQAVELLVKAVEFGIDKTTQYLRLNTENTLRLISATSTETLNNMKAGMDAWEDAVNGAYSAQELAIDSQLAMIEAQNATAMANLKMANTWTNWIPIWKQINEYGEAKLEQEQKMQEAWLKNAKEQLSLLNQYSKRIDTYNKEQDKAVHAYQAETGLSASQTDVFEKRMFGIGPEFAKFGKTIEDALKMQSQHAEQSGRAVNFSDEEYKKNFAVGRLVGEDNLMNFEAQMNIFNQSVSDSADIMYDMYNDANRMGISQKKLVKDVLSNLKLANKYDFKNGTKGFIELAKWAENARFNLSSLGGALEKIQSGGLENTITTSAKLQVLGGPFAALSDPLGMEFEANADPDAYAKRIQKMFSTMGSFDKKTGQTTFNLVENKMIRSAAESLGISVEDAKNMARGARQKDVVKKQMQYSTLNPEDQDAIANKAQFDQKTGQWYVNTIDGKRMNVGDVKAQDLGRILSGNKEEDSMKYAQSTLSVTEQIEATTKQINAQLGLLTFDKFKEMSKEEMKTTLDAYSKYQSNIEQLYTNQKSDNIKDLREALEENLSKLLTNYNKNRTIKKSGGSRMSEDEDEDKGLKFAAGDRTDKTVNYIKGSPRARQQLNAKQVEEAYNTDTRHWFDVGLDWLTGINRKNSHWVSSDRDPQSVKAGQSRAENHNKMKTQMWDAAMTAMPDGIVSGNGSPMTVRASNVTPIQDGSVKLAKSDPMDSAIFAKTGGPFDTLFNGIFDKISEVHSILSENGSTTNNRYGGNDSLSLLYNAFIDPQSYTKRMQTITRTYDDVRSEITANNNLLPRDNKVGYNVDVPYPLSSDNTLSNDHISISDLNLNINGKLELTGENGQAINIIEEMKRNPMFVRQITEMVVLQMNNNTHGGRNELFHNRYSHG